MSLVSNKLKARIAAKKAAMLQELEQHKVARTTGKIETLAAAYQAPRTEPTVDITGALAASGAATKLNGNTSEPKVLRDKYGNPVTGKSKKAEVAKTNAAITARIF